MRTAEPRLIARMYLASESKPWVAALVMDARCLEDGVSMIVLSNAGDFDASAATWSQRLWAD